VFGPAEAPGPHRDAGAPLAAATLDANPLNPRGSCVAPQLQPLTGTRETVVRGKETCVCAR
jgi:hypothetical protein